MARAALRTLTAPLRAYGPVVFEGYDEPHAELMALVWGPYFDRELVHRLLKRRPGYVPQVVQAVNQAADQFDGLGALQQRRVRQLILRHRSRWDNTRSTPLAAYFARFDMVLEQALRPSEGLVRLVNSGFDAAILDVMLPETPELQTNREALLRDLALMRDLVTDLLESGRLASPHAALHREPVDLAALVASVIESMPGRPALQTEISAALPTMALDPIRMRLLLRNLLDNALRHNMDTSPPPRVSVQPVADGGVQLRVRDFGAGVAEDQIAHLGQPFYRPDAARTREGGGVGLGLYLCRLVAQAHGGSLTVRNAQPGLEVVVLLKE